MLGDYYRDNPKVAAVVDAAIEIVKWFNNHSYCLGKLSEEQLTTYRLSLCPSSHGGLPTFVLLHVFYRSIRP
jgi:hypothetical protein